MYKPHFHRPGQPNGESTEYDGAAKTAELLLPLVYFKISPVRLPGILSECYVRLPVTLLPCSNVCFKCYVPLLYFRANGILFVGMDLICHEYYWYLFLNFLVVLARISRSAFEAIVGLAVAIG